MCVCVCVCTCVCVCAHIKLSKVVDRSRRKLEGPFFNSYNTEVQSRTLLFFLDWSTLPLLRIL